MKIEILDSAEEDLVQYRNPGPQDQGFYTGLKRSKALILGGNDAKRI